MRSADVDLAAQTSAACFVSDVPYLLQDCARDHSTTSDIGFLIMAREHDVSVSTEASLLGLPPELRLEIYDISFTELRSNWKETIVTGSLHDIPGQPSQSDLTLGPWALAQSCRQIWRELLPILPAIEKTSIELYALTHEEVRNWVSKFGEQAVERIRHLTILGYAPCISPTAKHFHELRSESLEQHLQRRKRCTKRCAGFAAGSDGSLPQPGRYVFTVHAHLPFTAVLRPNADQPAVATPGSQTSACAGANSTSTSTPSIPTSGTP